MATYNGVNKRARFVAAWSPNLCFDDGSILIEAGDAQQYLPTICESELIRLSPASDTGCT